MERLDVFLKGFSLTNSVDKMLGWPQTYSGHKHTVPFATEAIHYEAE